MPTRSPVKTMRVGDGRPGRPRWLSDKASAVLLSGRADAVENRHQRLLTTVVVQHQGRADGLLTASAQLDARPRIAAGMLAAPAWDIAQEGKEITRVVESFGGATSVLVLDRSGDEATVIDPMADRLSLSHPRFSVSATGRNPGPVTATDQRNDTIWHVPIDGSSPATALGKGLGPQIVMIGDDAYLMSISPRRGGRSPLGDTAGQLTVSSIGKTGLANGFQPVTGMEPLQVYDFDVAVRDTGEIALLAATRQGLLLFTGSPEALTQAASITGAAVLHPALAYIGSTVHVAYNMIVSGILSHTETATLNL